MIKTYKCANCGETFEEAWSDEEAKKEAADLFPGVPQACMEVVCDDCWKKMGFGEEDADDEA